MKVKEIQKSHFKLGYRAVVQLNGEESTRLTKWFATYQGLRSTLKASGVNIPTAKELRFFSNADVSYAFI